MNVILFENSVIIDVIKLRISRQDHTGFRVSLTPVTGVLIISRRYQRGRPCEDWCRDLSDESLSQDSISSIASITRS